MKKYNPKIIDESAHSLPFLLLVRDIILTALCWLLFIYFLRDAFQFFADVFTYAMDGFTGAENYESFKIVDTLILYIEIILITNGIYILWAIYNKLRFQGKTRRRTAPSVTADEIATRFKLNPRDIESWQKSQILVVHHEKNGRVASIAKV